PAPAWQPRFEKRHSLRAWAPEGRGGEGRGRGRGGAKGPAKGKGKSGAPDSGRARRAAQSTGEDADGALAVAEEVPLDGFRRHHWVRSAHDGAVTAVCVTQDGVYTASQDGGLKRWKPRQAASGRFELQPELQVPLGGPCWCMLHEGDWLFCGLESGRVRAFSRQGVDLTIEQRAEGVSSMLVHQDVLLTGSASGGVGCWKYSPEAGTFANVHAVADVASSQVRCLAVMSGRLWVGCSGGVTTAGALKLLEKQLDRRGPEHLCPQCPTCPQCPGPPPCLPLWPAGLGGFVAGVATTALAALCAGRCRGRREGARPARAAGPSPPLGLAGGPAPSVPAPALAAAPEPRAPAALPGAAALRGRASHRGAGVLTFG
ncbi:unnamed protein product, partial [Prorocentrum cordatum]